MCRTRWKYYQVLKIHTESQSTKLNMNTNMELSKHDRYDFSWPHICRGYHGLYLWRKFCLVEKFQISVKNLNNLWRFIEIYAVFVLNLCGEKSLSRKNDKYEVWIFSASRLTKNNRWQPNQIEVRRPGLRFGGNYIHG